MGWTSELTEPAERDLEGIFEHLVATFADMGEPMDIAIDRADERLAAIRLAARRLALAPHQGTRRDAIGAGLRNVTKDRAIFWFELDEAAETVRILAIFFGGQNHQRRMILRALGP